TCAQYWETVQSTPPHTRTRELKSAVYADFFKDASSWQQLKPLNRENVPKDVIPGYFGILSIYDRGKSRQMLLTMEDFTSLGSKDDKRGRIMCALTPIVSETVSDKIPECKEQP